MVSGVGEQRNRVIYPWIGSAKPYKAEATAKRKLRSRKTVYVPTEDLLNIAALINGSLSACFDNLHDRVAAEIEALRKKPPEPSP